MKIVWCPLADPTWPSMAQHGPTSQHPGSRFQPTSALWSCTCTLRWPVVMQVTGLGFGRKPQQPLWLTKSNLSSAGSDHQQTCIKPTDTNRNGQFDEFLSWMRQNPFEPRHVWRLLQTPAPQCQPLWRFVPRSQGNRFVSLDPEMKSAGGFFLRRRLFVARSLHHCFVQKHHYSDGTPTPKLRFALKSTMKWIGLQQEWLRHAQTR